MSDVWFKGPIAEAVSTVTQKNLVFLVFIYDDSEYSQQLETTLNDEKLISVMKQKTVALKMSKDSEHATMFGQLYPISQVPVVYFILQGTIKDFGVQDLTSQDIIQKIETLCPNIENSSSNSAKEKLEQLRKKRAEEEKEQARKREIKRREEGKLAQETQQNLQEKQNKLYMEKMRQEKKAEEEYKKKVREQIAIDRANQIAARKAEKQRQEINKPTRDVPSTSSSSTNSFYDHSNLNIKQLDGSSLRHSFSSSDTLATVSQWIDKSRTDGDMPFKLFAQFPNRNFDIGDEQRTLLELKLCPSGTLIMKPIKNATSAYGGSSSSSSSGGWLNYLYSAGDAVYNSVSSVTSYLVSPITAPEPGQRLGGTNQPSSSSSSSNNINTLNNTARYKKDDDRQTYNGNSVNQE